MVAFETLAHAADAIATGVADIASGIDLIAMTNDARFTVEHPPKGEPREAVITRVPTEEDLIREQHGGEDAASDGPGSPIDRWTAIGPREARWEAKGAADARDGTAKPAGPGAGKIPD